MGFENGSLCFWDTSAKRRLSSFEGHIGRINNAHFIADGRLFLSSNDETASIVSLDARFQARIQVKLVGHTNWVNDILPLTSTELCVTCSNDRTLKVWDCLTGACTHTLTQHSGPIRSVACHPTARTFVSGSDDRSVVLWSSETFTVLNRVFFDEKVFCVVFGESNAVYAGVFNRGVISCGAISGSIETYRHSWKRIHIWSCAWYAMLPLSINGGALVHTSLPHSACTQTLDPVNTFTMSLALTTQRARGCGGTLQDAHAGATDVSAIRARGDRIEACCCLICEAAKQHRK
jgi:WD40 repeat protein